MSTFEESQQIHTFLISPSHFGASILQTPLVTQLFNLQASLLQEVFHLQFYCKACNTGHRNKRIFQTAKHYNISLVEMCLRRDQILMQID